MSPKRRAVRDDRWDRTPGGVIVPRRVGLPTRRFIQKWGQVQCCCTTTAPGCEFCALVDDCYSVEAVIASSSCWSGGTMSFELQDTGSGACEDRIDVNESGNIRYYYLYLTSSGALTLSIYINGGTPGGWVYTWEPLQLGELDGYFDLSTLDNTAIHLARSNVSFAGYTLTQCEVNWEWVGAIPGGRYEAATESEHDIYLTSSLL